ncbi:MAG: hypothetical protein KIPDCIKN_02994 [Haliscomenobacter sp.]|nr:hypothetical protein [Haliscomenobacter sp.]
MASQTKLIWTLLPNGIVDVGSEKYYLLSAFISVRLMHDQPGFAKLGEFSPVDDWTNFLLRGNRQFSLEVEGGKTYHLEWDQSQIFSDLWKRIFPSTIPVARFQVKDRSSRRINSYPVGAIRNQLRTQFRQLALVSPDRKPPVWEYIPAIDAMSRFSLQELEDELNTHRKQSGKLDLNRIRTGSKARKQRGLSFRTKEVQRLRSQLQQAGEASGPEFSTPVMANAQFNESIDITHQVVGHEAMSLSEEYEFHKQLTFLQEYPVVMRALGLVLDFRILVEKNFPPQGNMRLNLNSKMAQVDQHEFPWSSYLTTPDFRMRPTGDLLHCGLLRVGDMHRFTFIPFDPEGAAIKTKNLVDQLAQQFWTGELSKAEEPLPVLRSDSVRVAVNGFAGMLKNRLRRQKELHEWMQKLPEKKAGIESLSAEDVQAGYRIDILEESREEPIWLSLHKRTGQYWVREKEYKDLNRIDEGYLQFGVTEKQISKDKYTYGVPEPTHRKGLKSGAFRAKRGNEATEPELFASEVQFAWNGWSLAVPPPGRELDLEDNITQKGNTLPEMVKNSKFHKVQAPVLIQPKKGGEAFEEAEVEEANEPGMIDAVFAAVQGSLPRQRYGNWYKLRIRSVDLAGNSLPVEKDTASWGPDAWMRFRFQRYEPVASPFPLMKTPKTDGESLEVLAVRTNNTADKSLGLLEAYSEPTAARWLLPPAVEQQMAEKHGKFDFGIGNKKSEAEIKSLYQLLSEREERPGTLGLSIQLPEAQTVEQKSARPSNQQPAEGPNRFPVFTEGQLALDYWPDPLAAGVAVWKDGKLLGLLPYKLEQGQWHSPKPIPLVLQAGSPFALKIDTARNQFVFQIPQGTMETVQVSSYFPASADGKDPLDMMGWWKEIQEETAAPHQAAPEETERKALWKEYALLSIRNRQTLKPWVEQKAPVRLSEAALADRVRKGGHWLFTPSRDFRLIHAVLEPMEKPRIKKVEGQRLEGDTHAFLSMEFMVHGNSATQADLFASWKDPVDTGEEGKTPEWKSFPKTYAGKAEVDYEDTLLHSGTDGLPMFKLSLNDTKHHVVEFQLVATTRYREFFLKLLPKPERAADVTTSRLESAKPTNIKAIPQPIKPSGQKTEVSLIKRSDVFSAHIKSSHRPAPPEVAYVIPLLAWEESRPQAGQIIRSRVGSALRVFLKRPWYSSGQDEMLAVVCFGKFIPDPQGPLLTANTADWYKDKFQKYWTQWGHDPISSPGQNLNAYPAVEVFKETATLPGMKVKGLVVEELAPKEKGAPLITLDAAVYPVHYDYERQLWYADIYVDTPPNTYFPFIKLALARYQPYSLEKGDSISGIVAYDPGSPEGFRQYTANLDKRLTFHGPRLGHAWKPPVVEIDTSEKVDHDLHLSPIREAEFIQLLPEKRCAIDLKDWKTRKVVWVQLDGPVTKEENDFPLAEIYLKNHPSHNEKERAMVPARGVINLVEVEVETRQTIRGEDVYIPDRRFRTVGYYRQEDVQNMYGTCRVELDLREFDPGGKPVRIVVKEWEARKADEGVTVRSHKRNFRLVYADHFDLG